MTSLLPLRLALIVMLVGFCGIFAWDLATATDRSFASFWATLWGRTVLLDLMVGIVLFALWVLWREKGSVAAWLWSLSFLVLGNVGTLAYLLWAMRGYRTTNDLPALLLGKWRTP